MKWFLLVHQLPGAPSRARVSAWRRLQKVGALSFRNSVWVLPASKQSREDFEWIRAEIVAMKGQASIFTAEGVDSATEEELMAAFRNERAREFEAIRKEAVRLAGRKPAENLDRSTRLLRERWAEIASLDFFGAPGRDEAYRALEELEAVASGAPGRRSAASGPLLQAARFRGRVWVTRSRPGIDRMASAWLIRRFIDPRARFRFAEETTGLGDSRAVPFDMFGVELGHQGNRCTFETLTARFGIKSPAVEWLGRIVHDVDLRDNAFGLPEADAVSRIVEGLRQMYPEDQELLNRGIAVFEALYRSFPETPATSRREGRRRR